MLCGLKCGGKESDKRERKVSDDGMDIFFKKQLIFVKEYLTDWTLTVSSGTQETGDIS